MRVTEFEYGKYYALSSWKGTGMCLTIGEDFKYKFGIYKNGIFSLLESDYIPNITDKFEEVL